MMLKVSEGVKSKLNTMHDLMGEVINDLKPSFDPADRKVEFSSKEDEFRYYLCMVTMTDAIKGVKGLHHAATLTDDEVREMCAESDVTISTAIENIKHNMVGELLSDLLGKMFTPPPALTRRADLCISPLTRAGTTASVTCAVSRSLSSPGTTSRPASAPRVSRARPRLPRRSSKHCSGASLT